MNSGSQALDVLVAELRGQYGDAVNAVCLYGSCLRSRDPFDGIVDLYVIVDGYAAFYPKKISAFGNWLLPPNVFYREFAIASRTLRAKYNVLSISDLRRGLSGHWIHPYLWGRFAQPVDILWCRDDYLEARIKEYLQRATITFLESVLPVAPASGSVCELWEQGLQLSYATELRSEGPDRATELVAYDPEHYVAASKAVAASLRYDTQISGDGTSAHYVATVSARSRFAGRMAWVMRRVLGKFFSLARLVKAFFTFDGGLDYTVWKLERHTGHKIEISARVRRHPLIFIWPLLWKLYRRGIIR